MLKETIKNDLVSAMKDKNKVLLNTLRSVKGAVQLEIINNKKEENDDLYLCCDTGVVKVNMTKYDMTTKSYRMILNSVKVDGKSM